MNKIKTILSNLRGVRSSGNNSWMALCPAHKDRSPSLSIKDAGDKILLNCFAGCSIEQITAAIGIEPKDMFSDSPAAPGSRIPVKEPVLKCPADECRVVEVAVNGYHNRNLFKKNVEDVLSVDAYGKPGQFDCACSAYLHTPGIIEHHEKTGKVAGYNGPVCSPYLFFDVDNKNLADAQLSSIKLVEKLCGKYNYVIDDVILYFSGCRGFHVYCKSLDIFNLGGRSDLVSIVGKVCLDIADGINDVDKSIYDKCVRLMRVPNTINSKTGLYKIPLLAGDLYTKSTLDIQKRARFQRSVEDAVRERCEKL